MNHFLTMDVERNRIKFAIVTEKLDVLTTGKLELLNAEEKEVFYEPIFALVDQYKEKIHGVIITMPGVIDSRRGIAYSGGMYHWIKNEPIARIIYERTGVKTVIVNDAKAATYAEIGYGSLKKVKNGVMIMLLGTGIGGSVVVNGKILDGAHDAAGEFSYMLGDYKDREEGQDMFALSMSVNSLVEFVKQQTGSENMNVMKIMYGLHNNDEKIRAAILVYCQRLATYIYNIQCVVDTERFVFSGTICEEPTFIELLEQQVKLKFEKALYHNIFVPEIVPTSFHEGVRKYGGIYLFSLLESEGVI